jgi:predicted O-linked N-acetylglucosamine transferase (SPINDLY family)
MAQLTLQQAIELAMQMYGSGKFADAEQLCRQIIVVNPAHGDALQLLGVLARHAGRNDIAADLLRQAVSMAPRSASAQFNLGSALRVLQKLEDAVAAYRQAIAIEPGFAEAWCGLGMALREQKNFHESVAAYEHAVGIKPDFAEAYVNLGNARRELKQIDEAIAAYGRAIALQPRTAQAHAGLAAALADKGLHDQVIAACRRGIGIGPALPETCFILGNALKLSGRLDDAVAAYRQAIAMNPGYATALNGLGTALKERGDVADAIAAFRTAIAVAPEDAEAWHNLGSALLDNGQSEEAIIACRKAVMLDPNSAEALSNLGCALCEKAQYDDALAALRRAIALKPFLAVAHSNLGNVLKNQGRIEESVIASREAVRLEPFNSRFHSSLLFSLHHHPGLDAREIAEEHRRWNLQHALPLEKFTAQHSNDPQPDRRLRVGYVSPDFRAHVVGRNILPLFRRHDHGQFEIVCYSGVAKPDAMTTEFRTCADLWRDVAGMDDGKLAVLIAEDCIDILVDLSLHTTDNRLLVFARKPAPVQVTFAGYPASTGLTAIDHRLSDPCLDPSGGDDSVHSEKTIRLPGSFWCFDPLEHADLCPNPLPAISNGFVTFGCLNNFSKINDPLLSRWAKVLRQVANSRLLLLAAEGSHRRRTAELFGREGVDPSRIEFADPRPPREYLQLYHRFDIGLDSFPYTGHTTSLDSLWMGVPVVTLVGQTTVSRAGWSQLSNLGLTELAAHDEQAFLKIAVKLALDPSRMAQLRSTLRRRMEQSPLMDALKWTRGIEAAYRQIWRSWRKHSNFRTPAEFRSSNLLS